MTDTEVLTAFADDSWESAILTALEQTRGLRVARRCVDLADLLASVAAGQGRVALVSVNLRRLDRDAVARLEDAGVAVVGIVPAGPDGTAHEATETRLRGLGVGHVLRGDAAPAAVLAAVTAASAGRVDAAAAELRRIVEGGAAAGPVEIDDEPKPSSGGSILAVWGPAGSPGRTTLAVNLAAELASLGANALLADADTYGASVAQTLGLLDESPGLAAAARAANGGRLDVAHLAGHARQVSPGLRALTGITRSARWTELSPAALSTVWSVCRSSADVTVVDTGFCLEQDEDLTYDTVAPQRNGATLATLAAADTVIVVGSADPVGLGRLVRGIGDLVEVVPRVTVDVVVNRVRRSVAGADPQTQIGAALERFAGLRRVTYLPDDPRSVDTALAQGLTLAEVAAASPLRHAVASIALRHLGPGPDDSGRVHERRSLRLRGRARARAGRSAGVAG